MTGKSLNCSGKSSTAQIGLNSLMGRNKIEHLKNLNPSTYQGSPSGPLFGRRLPLSIDRLIYLRYLDLYNSIKTIDQNRVTGEILGGIERFAPSLAAKCLNRTEPLLVRARAAFPRRMPLSPRPPESRGGHHVGSDGAATP